MKHKDYMNITMVIFVIVALVHLYRAFNNLPLTYGETAIPVWASWIAGVAALYLAYTANKHRS